MKTILVPTDFSPAADNAARYALHLGRSMHADLKLCNAVKVPAETRMAAQVVWPLEDYSDIKDITDQELKILAKRLLLESSQYSSSVYHPKINYCSEVGTLTDIVRNLFTTEDIKLVTMGLWGASGINRFFAGSTSRDMIEKANFPLLLIPSKAVFTHIHTIAFATDLSEPDINVIHSLASLAKQFNAEILITHVKKSKTDKAHEQKLKSFLNDVTNKVNYPKIYFRDVENDDVESGLEWLAKNSEVEILAMVHRKHDIIDRLLNRSHTQNMARNINTPLLVFPDHNKPMVF